MNKAGTSIKFFNIQNTADVNFSEGTHQCLQEITGTAECRVSINSPSQAEDFGLEHEKDTQQQQN